jgi:hypothetical protein
VGPATRFSGEKDRALREKAEETGCPKGCPGGSGCVITGEIERMAGLYELKPFGIGVELGTLGAFVYGTAERNFDLAVFSTEECCE